MSNTTIWWNRYVLFITQKSTTCFGTIHGHLQVDNEKNLISSYTRFACVVYSGEAKGEVGTRSRMRDLVPTSPFCTNQLNKCSQDMGVCPSTSCTLVCYCFLFVIRFVFVYCAVVLFYLRSSCCLYT